MRIHYCVVVSGLTLAIAASAAAVSTTDGSQVLSLAEASSDGVSLASLPLACQPVDAVPGKAVSLLPTGRTFELVWHDEFDGVTLDDSKWSYRTNFWGRRAHWFAAPEDGCVEVGDGLLRLKVKKLANGQFVSPQLQTGELLWDIPRLKDPKGFWPIGARPQPKFMHRYGYYECRCRLQKMPGWWSAFWMQTPMQGCSLDPSAAGIEHDIMESFEPARVIPASFHTNGYGPDYRGFHIPAEYDSEKTAADKERHSLVVDTDEFHTYGMLWDPEGYSIYIDGRFRGRNTTAVSQTPEFVLLTTECKWYRNNRMTGEGVPELEAAAAAGDDFVVDYVRVFDVVEAQPVWALEPVGGQPLDAAHAFEVPHTAVRDTTAFTVEMKIRCDEPADGTKLALLAQKTPTTGWGLDLMLWGRVGSPITLRANDASFGCGWFRSNPGEEHVFTITARKGMVVAYWNGKVMKRFFQTIVPNLEPIKVGATDLTADKRVTEMKGVRLLSLKFYGPEFEYYAPGESRDFAEGYRGGPGWLMSCPTEDPEKELPRILCYGDSILSGYGPRLRQRLDGKAYVYTWSKFEGGAVGEKLQAKPYLEATAVRPFDIIVFNNGLHSLDWTEDKVSDELLKATQRQIYRNFRAGAPQAKICWLSTTPHTSRVKNAAGKIDACGELDPIVRRINRLTAEVMVEEGVPMLDGYGTLLKHLDQACGDGYHWHGQGYDRLVDLLARELGFAGGK